MEAVDSQKTPVQTLEEWLLLLNGGDPELQRQVAEWKDHPFEPPIDPALLVRATAQGLDLGSVLGELAVERLRFNRWLMGSDDLSQPEPCVFRPKATTQSDRRRPPIPTQGDHRSAGKPTTWPGPIGTVVGMNRNG